MEKRSIVGLIAIAIIAAAVLFAGCVDEVPDEPDEFDDSTWARTCMIYGDLIQDELDNIQQYAASGNTKQLAKHGGYLQDSAMTAYNHSIRLSVTPDYEAAKLEYETTMRAYAQVGKYAAAGDMEAANEAAIDATNHMWRVNDLLDRANGVPEEN